jgi:hypothetical protein
MMIGVIVSTHFVILSMRHSIRVWLHVLLFKGIRVVAQMPLTSTHTNRIRLEVQEEDAFTSCRWKKGPKQRQA